MSKIENKRADIAGICSETQVCNHFKPHLISMLL